MTADHTTPTGEDESTDYGRESFPLRDASDRELAGALAEGEDETVHAVEDLSRALRDDDVPLRDEEVARLAEAGDRLTALARTLALRVEDPAEG